VVEDKLGEVVVGVSTKSERWSWCEGHKGCKH